MPFCVKCGAFNDSDSKYCSNCGFPMNGEICNDEDKHQTAGEQTVTMAASDAQNNENGQEIQRQTNPFALPAIGPADTTVVKSENVQYSPQTGYRIIGDESFKKQTKQCGGSKQAKAGFALGLVSFIFAVPMFVLKVIQTVMFFFGTGQYLGTFSIILPYFLASIMLDAAIAGMVLSLIAKKKSSEKKYKRLAKTGFAFSLAAIIMITLLFVSFFIT